MKTTVKTITLILFVLFLFSACNSNEDPTSSNADSGVNGTWSDNTAFGDDSLWVTVNLTEKDGKITGSYSYKVVTAFYFLGTQGTQTFTEASNNLTGSLSGPSVSLEFGDMSFSGTLSVSETSISGVMTFETDDVFKTFTVDLKK